MSDELEDLIAPWVGSPDERKALAVAIRQLMAPADAGSTGVRDGNHALLVGRILGTLIKSDAIDPSQNFHPLEPGPVMVGNDYTNQIIVTQPSGKYLITVEPITVPVEKRS